MVYHYCSHGRHDSVCSQHLRTDRPFCKFTFIFVNYSYIYTFSVHSLGASVTYTLGSKLTKTIRLRNFTQHKVIGLLLGSKALVGSTKLTSRRFSRGKDGIKSSMGHQCAQEVVLCLSGASMIKLKIKTKCISHISSDVSRKQ